MSKLTLKLLDETFNIHSFSASESVPVEVLSCNVFFIGKTADELSIVVPDSIKLASNDCDQNWRALEVVGPLDFSLTGILSSISGVLADAKISIFAISTFDTDYILVKQNTVLAAIQSLKDNDYQVIGH